jgi:SpoVK/Ycf46/Vps4 family AAA+-type ATPase
LTLDCLLNCISGVQPSNGVLVLVTANDFTKLDPALGVRDHTGKSTRPGRLDACVHIGNLTKEGRYKIAKRILSDVPELVDRTVIEGEGETGAQFESRCSKLALDKYWGRLKMDTEINNKEEIVLCPAHGDYPPSDICTCN